VDAVDYIGKYAGGCSLCEAHVSLFCTPSKGKIVKLSLSVL
jgi:hypothetical protein